MLTVASLPFTVPLVHDLNRVPEMKTPAGEGRGTSGRAGEDHVWRPDLSPKALHPSSQNIVSDNDSGLPDASSFLRVQPEGERMPAVQPRLPLALAQQPRARSVRRPFHPSKGEGAYRLPHSVRDRLAAALAPFRNRDAAFTLATFIGRFWSAPGRLVEAFHIDRRALAEHDELELTEKQIRSAIRTLEEIGFLDRAVTSGSRYKATEDGLRRKPIRFQFGSEYVPLFIAANQRAAAARGRHSGERRALAPSSAPSRSTVGFQASSLKGPKSKSEADRSMNLGPLAKSGIPPKAFEPDPKLESALERLLQGIRQSRG